MKISGKLPQPGLPRQLPTPPPAKNTWEMDRFELQDACWEADRKVTQLQHRATSGQTEALVGLGVLVSSMGIMLAQSIMSGGLPGAMMVPLAVSGAVGAGTLTHGVWKRDEAEMDQTMARIDAQGLHAVFHNRFEKPQP